MPAARYRPDTGTGRPVRGRITHVAETHLRSDHVSGGLALAKLTGATCLADGAEEVGFDRRAVAAATGRPERWVAGDDSRLAQLATATTYG